MAREWTRGIPTHIYAAIQGGNSSETAAIQDGNSSETAAIQNGSMRENAGVQAEETSRQGSTLLDV